MTWLTNSINPLVSTQLWQVTFVVVCVGLLTKLTCRKRPHLACMLWLVVLVKCLTPPVWSSPTGLFSWLNPGSLRVADAAPETNQQADVGTIAFSPQEQQTLPDDQPGRSGTMSAVETVSNDARGANAVVTAGESHAAPVKGASKSRLSVATLIPLTWLIGASIYASFAVASVIGVWRTVRKHGCLINAPCAALTSELAHRLGIRRRVRLLVVDAPLGPMTFGWLRPTIVLPRALLDGRTTEEIEPLLAHELVHVRRCDVLVGLVQSAAQCVWWFHPLVWWANRRIVFERERCCDEEVVAGLACSPARYARTLIGVLELKRQIPLSVSFPSIRKFEITRQRLEYIMQSNHCFLRRTPRRYWAAAIVGVVLVVPGATVTQWRPLVALAAPQIEGLDANLYTPAKTEAKNLVRNNAPDAQRKLPTVDERLIVRDVEQTPGKTPGAVVLRFVVDAPAGTRFFVQYSHIGVRGAASSNAVFEIEGPMPADVTIEFAYRPDFKGDATQSVLWSGEDKLDYRVRAKGCTQPGFSTIVSAPLWNVAAHDRLVSVLKTKDERGGATAEGRRRILLVCPMSNADKNADVVRPRTEIIVGMYDSGAAREPTPVQHLAKQWRRQQQEVGSAHIRFHLVRAGSGDLAPLSPDEVRSILSKADLNKHPDAYGEVVSKLANQKVNERHGASGEFWSIGLKTRENTAGDERVFDGELDLYFNRANNQIDVHHDNDSHRARMSISDFRTQYDAAILQSFEHKLQPDGTIRLWRKSAGTSQAFVVDANSGFILDRIDDRPDKKRSVEIRQFAPKTYPVGIVFPTVIVQTGFENENLVRLVLLKIDSAEFNSGLAKNSFALAAKAGTKVFFFERDPVTPPEHPLLPEDVVDLADYVRSGR